MNWRQVLGAYAGPGKGEARYTEDGRTLPNSAQFTGDKLPAGKNVAKTEVEHWRKGNELFHKDVNREDGADAQGSPLLDAKGRRGDVKKHIAEDEHVHRVPYKA